MDENKNRADDTRAMRSHELDETYHTHREYPKRAERTPYPVREDTYVPGKGGYPVREDTVYPRRKKTAEDFTEKDNTFFPENKDHSPEFDPVQKESSERRIEERRQSQKTRRQDVEKNSQRHGAQRKKRRKKQKRIKFLIILVLAVLIGILCFRFGESLMASPSQEVNLTGETVMVTIPEGAGTSEIADILKENKLIGSKFSFRLSSKLNGYDGTYKQGTYEIDTGLTPIQIMDLLQSGEVATDNKITIPEGYNTRQIAAKAEEMGICTADEFIEEANTGVFEYDFLKDLPDRTYRLEGYLFPDTYFLSENMTAHDLIDLMLKRFEQMYTKEYQDAVAASGHTLDEIVTIASMVEKEITVDEERARAAGVIYNRLEENMSLGIDATVLYAVGKNAGELTQEDLQTDSPYNTRLNKGLPLGPISNPGEASFKAALYPEDHEYLYYVLESAGASNHVFCKTNEEFLAAKEKYQASLTQ